MKLLSILIAAILPLSAMAQDAAPEKKMGLQHTSALGYVVTGGNSSAETTNFTQETKYVWDAEQLAWTGNYLGTKSKNQGSDDQNITAENWQTALRYDRTVSDRLGVYSQVGIFGDRFQGVKERKFADLGLSYLTTKTETFTWENELGYQYMRELYLVAPSANATIHPEFHFVRLYTKMDYTHSKTLKLGLWVEYLFPFADQRQPADITQEKADDYRVNFEPYLISTLSDMFSLKVSYLGRYRNAPVVDGNAYLDSTFSTTLIATY